MLDRDLGPGLPRRIQRREVEACCPPIALGRRPPFARFEQPRLVVFLMHTVAGLANEVSPVALALGPANARPGNRRHVAAMEAGQGGVARSSDESSVMEPKRRGGIIKLYTGTNRSWEESRG